MYSDMLSRYVVHNIIVAKNDKYNIRFWHIEPIHLILPNVKSDFQMTFAEHQKPKTWNQWCQFQVLLMSSQTTRHMDKWTQVNSDELSQ